MGMRSTVIARGALWPLALSAVLSAAYVLHGAGALGGAGLDPLFEKVVYDLALGTAAAAVLWRSVRTRRERGTWLALGAGLLAWAAGNTFYALVLAEREVVPVPSLADAGWLAAYPLFYLGIILLVRARVPGLGGGLWLDGLIGALAVAAVSAAVVVPLLADSGSGSSFGEVATNTAYPIGDLMLLGVITFALTVDGWHVGRAWSLLAAGFAIFAFSDSFYLWEVVHDRYEYGVLIDSGWLVAALLIGIAALQAPPALRRGRSEEGRRLIVVPSAFGLAGLGLLVWGGLASTDRTALVLATLCLAAVIARMGLSYAQSVHESLTDALTGLPNRRRLARDLRERAPGARARRPLGIAFFDLNGFKRYNDAFGHPAGDALLVLLSRRLSAALGGDGVAYRMGGDEFCALLHGDRATIDAAMVRALAALTEAGDGFAIDAAHGLVVMPADATDPDRALGLADQRMYALKHGGRPSSEHETTEALLQVLNERDPALGDHVDGVAELARATAERLGMGDADAREVALAAKLRDVGKAAVPDHILRTPGPLGPAERAVMNRHPSIGERILRAAPSLAGVARLVRSSHERHDGAGYPDGLAGDAIPLGSRIVAVCDAFDAIISDRPHAPARGWRQAIQELRRCAGAQFDPEVVEAFAAVLAARARRPGGVLLR